MKLKILIAAGVAVVMGAMTLTFTLAAILGTAELIVYTNTGTILLDGNNVDISSFQIVSVGSGLVVDADGNPVLLAGSDSTTAYYLEHQNLGDPNVNVNGTTSLGTLYDTTKDTKDLKFKYTELGGATIEGAVTYTTVPEPATLALFGLGGLVLLRRRRS